VEYLPFGEVWIEETDPATGYIPFRFTSKELDEETGLYYHGARYYEPTISRWMSADPAGWVLINPMERDNEGGWKPKASYSIIEAANWYAYVSNNPVIYVDPTGMVIVLSEDATEEQKKEYEQAIDYIKSTERGRELIAKLEESEVVITIEFIDDHESRYNLKDKIVKWDPTSGLIVGEGEIQTPALGLAHEFGHAEQDLDGRFENLELLTGFELRKERLRIEGENLRDTEYPIAEELSEPQREHYLDTRGVVRTQSSISNKRKWWWK